MKKLLLVAVLMLLLSTSAFGAGEDERYFVLWPEYATAALSYADSASATVLAGDAFFDLTAYKDVGHVTVHCGIAVADADVDSSHFFLEFSSDPDPGSKWVQSDSVGFVSAAVGGTSIVESYLTQDLDSSDVTIYRPSKLMRYMRVTGKSEGLAADNALQTVTYFVWVTLRDGLGNFITTVGSNAVVIVHDSET